MNLTLSNILNASEAGVRHLKFLGDPIGVAKTACGLASHLSATADFSEKVLKRLHWAEGPPEVASLLVDSLALGRIFLGQEAFLRTSAVKISELGVSILKKCCEIIKWLEQRHLLAVNGPLLGRIEGMSTLCDVMSSSLELWENWYAKLPAERQLLISTCKVCKSYLLIYAYLTDNKEVNSYIKMLANGFGVVGDGYALTQRAQKISYEPRDWNIALPSLRQAITLIVLSCLAIYIIEKRVESDS